MAGPRKKFRNRPKKVGAKKRQKVKAQKRRIVAAGIAKMESMSKLSDVEIREVHKLVNVAKKK